MIKFTPVQSDFKIFQDFKDEMIADAKKGIKKAAELIPDMLRANIDAQATEIQLPRGGETVWDRVPLTWLRKRKTWPDKTNFGKLSASQLNVFATHTPLIDTGKYYNSFEVLGSEDTEGGFAITAGTQDPRGFFHDEGIATGPPGPDELHQRRHMFIVDGEDTVPHEDLGVAYGAHSYFVFDRQVQEIAVRGVDRIPRERLVGHELHSGKQRTPLSGLT